MDVGRPTSEPLRRRRLRHAKSRRPEDATLSLEEVRRALVGPEQTRLERLEERAVVTPSAVSAVLPVAAAEVQGEQREALAVALEPVLTTVVGSVARRKPEVFIEALSPTIGATVKRALAEALSVMLERFNATLERSLSVRSVQWRVEALRTGRPFAEVVLLRTLKYRVEQVFLIHTPTSLVLQHVTDPTLKAQPADQVAAMLSAVDTFGREALGPLPAGAHLDRFQLGDLSVWVSRSSAATLAAVVRGVAGSDFRQTLADARTRIEVSHRTAFEGFDGETAPFVVTRPDLESLLHTEMLAPPRRAHVWFGIVGAIVLVLGGHLFWRAHLRRVQESRLRDQTVQALAGQPGIVVTGVEWTPGRHRVTGLADPLAEAPGDTLARVGIAPVETDFAPFASLDPRMVEKRHALELAKAGEALPDAARELENVAVSFDLGKTKVNAADEIDVLRAANAAKDALRTAALAHTPACIEVTGHVDASGDPGRNRWLSGERARDVTLRLEAMGVEPFHLHARAEGLTTGEERRTATFRLLYGDEAYVCGARP